MKMDLAGSDGAKALGVAACQSLPSDIWEWLNAKGRREHDSPESAISKHFHAIS